MAGNQWHFYERLIEMTEPPSTQKARTAVPNVRGPLIRTPRHPEPLGDSLEKLTKTKIRQISKHSHTSIDLFSGCGGLSLGLESAGFTPIVGVDHMSDALETWGSLFSGIPLELDLHEPSVIENLVTSLSGTDVDLIAGGPPCQPFSLAGRSRVRQLVQEGRRDAHDIRRDLWRSFLDIAIGIKPRVVLMENVPDMALGDDMRILRTMIDELEKNSYAVFARLLDAPDYGVPQLRQRLILIAMRDGINFSWPEPVPEHVTVNQAIGDMPEVQGGWRPPKGADGFIDYRPGTSARRAFVKKMRSGVTKKDKRKLYDHITRPVREDDLEIFKQMDSSTKYNEIDPKLRRYRDDIFVDKYKRLDGDKPSRAITAHIAKDGYWYIHPSQHRTLTVREAARLQTFPDHVRFAGGPSGAFRQIGNAVPPLLAEQLGKAIVESLSKKETSAFQTLEISSRLSQWLEDKMQAQENNLAIPWLCAETPWQVIQAELLLDRADQDTRFHGFALLKPLTQPAESLTKDGLQTLKGLAGLAGSEKRADAVQAAAEWFVAQGSGAFRDAKSMAENPFVSETVAKLAESVAIEESDGPIILSGSTYRVAARFFEGRATGINMRTAGPMALVRLVGGSVLAAHNKKARLAHQAIIELASSRCRTKDPLCGGCPLNSDCAYRKARDDSDRLFNPDQVTPR